VRSSHHGLHGILIALCPAHRLPLGRPEHSTRTAICIVMAAIDTVGAEPLTFI
jgi:hypothetical protein